MVEYCDTPETERREPTGNTKQTYTLDEPLYSTSRANIATACRRFAAQPAFALELIGIQLEN